MVLLSAVVPLPFSIFLTLILLHLESSGLQVELLSLGLGHEASEQSALFNVRKSPLLCVWTLKTVWVCMCRIILHFFYYRNREIYYSAVGTAILKCKRLQLLLCYTCNLW